VRRFLSNYFDLLFLITNQIQIGNAAVEVTEEFAI